MDVQEDTYECNHCSERFTVERIEYEDGQFAINNNANQCHGCENRFCDGCYEREIRACATNDCESRFCNRCLNNGGPGRTAKCSTCFTYMCDYCVDNNYMHYTRLNVKNVIYQCFWCDEYHCFECNGENCSKMPTNQKLSSENVDLKRRIHELEQDNKLLEDMVYYQPGNPGETLSIADYNERLSRITVV